MAQEEHLQSKLKNILRTESIQLWEPPYTSNNNEAGSALKELAEKLVSKLGYDVLEIESALEELRWSTIQRGEGNQTYKSTGVAVLNLFLPKRWNKGKKTPLNTELNITGRQLRSKIAELYDVDESYIKVTINATKLDLDKTLKEQNVKHNAKVMIIELQLPEEEAKKYAEETEKQHAAEKEREQGRERMVSRTRRGIEILSQRGGHVDPDTVPCLEIADQNGKPIKIPPEQKKALVIAMGFHEKGRALLKRKDYETSLLLLMDADKHFRMCGEELLNTVDNYAVLQLDILWCYVWLEQLSSLDDAEEKLKKSKECFSRCYGTEQERLFQIKGSSGREQALFLRLHLLYGLLYYHKGDENKAVVDIEKAEVLYRKLAVDNASVTALIELGYTEQEARLALRACDGNVNHAAEHIQRRREDKAAIKREEREKRRRRKDAINTLAGMGYSKHAAAVALERADGDLDKAFQALLDNPDHLELLDPGTSNQVQISPEAIEQLTYLGFDRSTAESALRQFRGSIQLASQYLTRYGGTLPPGPSSPPQEPASSQEPIPSEDCSTSAAVEGSACTSEEIEAMEVDAVEEIIADIAEHEEDYLDLTLEEEAELIAKYKSYIEKSLSTGT